MMMPMDTQNTPQDKPFVAWTDTNGWNSTRANEMLRKSTAAHLHHAMDTLSPFVGKAAIEGIVVYDRLDRGLAVVSLMNTEQRRLPSTLQGEVCDGLFDENRLCDATNQHALMARMQEGARGMLITLAHDPNRRLMLLPQQEAVLFATPNKGAKDPRTVAAFGLLAHELGHARDYADGRPGRPTIEDIQAVCNPRHAQALYTVADMALAEYVATRAECAAQHALFGACDSTLAQRATTMGRTSLPTLQLDAQPEAPEGMQQVVLDRQGVGYHVGTLTAYMHAQAPIIDKDGKPFPYTTDELTKRGMARGSPLATLIKATGSALEAAASTPSPQTRRHLARAIEQGLQPTQGRARSSRRDEPTR